MCGNGMRGVCGGECGCVTERVVCAILMEGDYQFLQSGLRDDLCVYV